MDPDRERWEITLAQKYVFRPRWWSQGGRRLKRKPDFYEVCLGTHYNMVHLGSIFRRTDGWETTLAVPQHETMTREEQNIPAANKAWCERYQVDLGRFKSRPKAADALKAASLNRGMLRQLAEELLSAIDVLALIGEAA
jgi:hypothetical protein